MNFTFLIIQIKNVLSTWVSPNSYTAERSVSQTEIRNIQKNILSLCTNLDMAK